MEPQEGNQTPTEPASTEPVVTNNDSIFHEEPEVAEPQTPTTEPTAPVEGAAPVTPTAPVANNPADLARNVAEELRKQAAAGQTPTTPQAPSRRVPELKDLNDQQLDEVFKPVKISDQEVAAIQAGGPGAVATFQKKLNEAVQNAVSIANYIVEKRLEDISGDYTPAVQYAKEQSAQAAVDQFYGLYPELTSHEDVVKLVASANLEKLKTMPIMDAAKFIAQSAKELIMKSGGNLAVNNPGNATNGTGNGTQPNVGASPAASRPNTMNRLQTPGRSPSGNGSPAKAANPVKDLFADD